MESRLAIEALARRWPRLAVDESGCRRVQMSNVAGYSRVPVHRGDHDRWAARPRRRTGRALPGVGRWGVDAERVVFTGFEGVQLVADVRGDPDGWPVLLLHGGGQTRHAWGTAAERIADEGWRTVSLDLRGHGESDWAPRADYSFTAFGSDVVAVADQLGRPPCWWGRPSGGLSALYAEGTSDRVVSSRPGAGGHHPEDQHGRDRSASRTFMESGLDGFDSLDDAARAIAAYTPERTRAVNPDGLRKVLRERDGRWFWHWDPAFISQGRNEAVPEVLVELLNTAMGNIRVPTMLVRGLLSDVVTQEGVDQLLESVPGSTVVDVAGAAHMIAGDRNDAFSDAVLDVPARAHPPGHRVASQGRARRCPGATGPGGPPGQRPPADGGARAAGPASPGGPQPSGARGQGVRGHRTAHRRPVWQVS